jgi:hypothetical protein
MIVKDLGNCKTKFNNKQKDKNIKFILLNEISDKEWDEFVETYPDSTVFHLSCWHHVLNSSFPGRVLRFQIVKGGKTCGHWCGFLREKFGIKIFGAPLPGTGTDYMYPLFLEKVSIDSVLDAFNSWAKARGIAHVELGGECFPKSILLSKGYTLRHMKTYRVDLSVGESKLWKSLKPQMRNKIRKAERNGIVVSNDTSPDFASYYFDMLKAVFKRQGLVPTYGLDRIEKVIQLLSASGNVSTFTAWRDSEALATLLLLHDKRNTYFWGGASYSSAYPYGANDVIHWEAFKYSIKRGIVCYDTCGGSGYKKKFGGYPVELPAGHNSINHIFSIVRNIAYSSYSTKQKVLGYLNGVVAKII